MPGQETVVLLVHGANQSERDPESNRAVWEQALRKDEHARKVQSLLEGGDNAAIRQYHEDRHPRSDFPIYSDWRTPWYGDVWQEVLKMPEGHRFTQHLNRSDDEDKDDRFSLLQRVERGAMDKHFDELVPYYELSVRSDNQRTLYESICARVLDQLIAATDQGQKSYVWIGHSMGCAVTYNIMAQISAAKANKDYCPIPGTLSDQYRQKVAEFARQPGRCFGLLTFGNYTGYNWAQRLNHRALFGTARESFVFPDAVARWYNFWTVLGGDPYIIDDMLGDTIVDDDNDRFDDVVVFRLAGSEIGHGRAKWFGRRHFSRQLRKKMVRHLYD